MGRWERRVEFGAGCQAVENADRRDRERPGAQPRGDPGFDPLLSDTDSQARGVHALGGC